MNDALVGSTGFVGSHLMRQHTFQEGFHSRNVEQACDQTFGTLVICAAPGSMLVANRQPERDAASLERLMRVLRTVRARQVVLISTIAVLADPASAADERTDQFQQSLAYGRHRRMLETFCEQHFPDCLTVRLPALFGDGLRKNFLFDIFHPTPSALPEVRFQSLFSALQANDGQLLQSFFAWDDSLAMWILDRESWSKQAERSRIDAAVAAAGFAALGFTNPSSSFQYYPIERLWQDIRLALHHRLRLLHAATEPLQAGRVFEHLCGSPMPQNEARLYHEDFRSQHAGLWNSDSEYLLSADLVLAELTCWAAKQAFQS